MKKRLLKIVIGVGLIVVALSVIVIVMAFMDERQVDAAARATPEVGPQEISLGGMAALAGLGSDVNPSTVHALLDASDVVVVDVRNSGRYAAGHIPGALNVPLDDLAERSGEVPTDKGVMLVCRSGNRSTKALDVLEDLGYDNVHSTRGGMRAWSRAGYPMEP